MNTIVVTGFSGFVGVNLIKYLVAKSYQIEDLCLRNVNWKSNIGIGDKVVMLENTWYTVISPESCSSILWRTWNNKELAAEQLKLTSEDMKGFELVDDVLKEPVGGAHARPEEMAAIVKDYLVKTIANLQSLDAETRIQQRIDKFSKMGFYDEVPTA